MAKKKIHELYKMKAEGQKITWLTAYDYPTAQFAEAAGWICCSSVIRWGLRLWI